MKEDVDPSKFSIFALEDDVGASDGEDENDEEQDDKTIYSGVYVGPGNNAKLIKDYCKTSNNELLVNEVKKN